ncbi:MAG: hypothetical protein ACYDIA_19920 [Candidatus Humimicrobiaceae bacterium]
MVVNLTKEERVLRVIKREDFDYLPSQIVFADRTRDTELCKEFGRASAKFFNYDSSFIKVIK